MKEIGIKLKEARIANGVSVEEAAEDLKLRPMQIEDIENGNIKAFKDVYYLKYFIRDYAKYLNLDYDALIADFNEFLFDYTSKIPLDAIEKAKREKKEAKKKNPPKFASPYTTEKEQGLKMPKSVVFIIIGVVVIILLILLFSFMFTKDIGKVNYVKEIRYELT